MKHWKICLMSVCFSFSIQAFESPLIVAHRGASGYRPEHTLESYQLAIDMGADYIEPDLVMTKDGVLVARHENEISETTDAAVKFPKKKATKIIDGVKITGWFTEDFTLAELKTLRAKERLNFRDQSYNGKFLVPTFKEVLELVKKANREVGIFPETKHPSYFQSIGLPMEKALVKELKAFDLDKKESPVIIQSFELSNLKELSQLVGSKLVFLYDDNTARPYDHVISGDKRTYGDLTSEKELKELSSFLYGIGPYKRYLVSDKNKLNKVLIQTAHKHGLKVIPYTFRSEERYLLKEYKNDPQVEYAQFFKMGVDGIFTDFTDHAVEAKNLYLKSKKVDVKK